MHPSSRFLYVNNTNAGTIQAFAIDDTTGALTPAASGAYSTAGNPMAPVIDPSGRFMFVVNEAPDSVLSFRIEANGALTPVTLIPRKRFVCSSTSSGSTCNHEAIRSVQQHLSFATSRVTLEE